MLKSRKTIIIALYSGILICLLLIVSCNRNPQTDSSKSEQALHEQIRMKDLQIAALEDSIKKISKQDPPPVIAEADPPATAGNTNPSVINSEKSLYKKGKSKTRLSNVAFQKKYPGEFPEGSARLLTNNDLKFLSEWGLKVMLNEIYARHGMTFADDALQKHFNRSIWYRGTIDNVDKKLSKIEKQNILLITNYKFTPNIPT